MIISGLVAVAGILALIFFVLRVGAARTPRQLDELSKQIKPVDLEAFRNLTEPAEEEFLRAALPVSQFRVIQRNRLRASLDYLAGVSHNAGILLQLGQIAQRSPDERIAEAGRRLSDDALRMRLNSLMAICKLTARYAFPATGLQAGRVIDRYEQLTSAAVRLGRMQEPEKGTLSRAV